jgi:two-component system chemotaxis response regulator CheB
VLLSSASENGKQVMQALEAGAVDVVQKPTALATEKVLDVAEDLIAKVMAAATAKIGQPVSPIKPVSVIPTQQQLSTDVVVIGVSTGGPQALKQIIPSLPANFPVPIALVIHMPVGFTESFAHSLGMAAQLTVVEAKAGDTLRPGMVYVAPAGYHLLFSRQANGAVLTHLDAHPSNTPHRPAVDVLFQSAAQVYGDRVLAVVLTGMGSDGTQGAAWVKAQGGRVLSEAEESCVVYGMPRSVVEAGLSDLAVPLNQIAQAICEAL